MSELRARAVHGSLWTVAGFAASQIVRLGSNIALAALLFEEAFALMAIVMAVMQGLHMFSDLGLGPNVVQSRRGDNQEFLDTAWTVQVLRGVLLAAIATALAWPIAAFYARNDAYAWELRWLIPLVAVSTLIGGFQSSKLWTNQRHMSLAANTLIDLATQVASLGATLLVAWLTRSVYALAVGGIVSALVGCLLSHFAIKGPLNKFRLERQSFREIFGFGKWIFVSTVISFLALQIDKLIFARLFSLAEVGVYAIAASLAVMVPALLGRVQQMVAFPLYARSLQNDVPLADTVERTKLPMLALGSVLIAVIVCCSQAFVDAAYDDRYRAAGSYLAILAAGAWFAVVDGIYGAAFLSTGRAQWVALVNGVKVGSFCLMLLPAAKIGGLLGAVVAFALSDVIKLLVAYALASTLGLSRRRLDAYFFVLTAAVCIAIIGFTSNAGFSRSWHPLLLLAMQAALAVAAFSWPLWRVFKKVAYVDGRLMPLSGGLKPRDVA